MTVPMLGWSNIRVEANPGPRSRHGLVFDRKSKCLVLFGGVGEGWNLTSDTWELHANRWVPMHTRKVPPKRHRGAIVYDSTRGFSVLFGGQSYRSASYYLLNDTWIYEDHQWTNRSAGWFAKWPTPRCGHAMAFDETLGLTVLFGGISRFDSPLRASPLGDTWTFDGRRWERLTGPMPPARRYAAFAYHPGLKGCVLHGGAVDDNGNRKFGDTWLFQAGQWKSLGDAFVTAERDDHALAYDPGLGTLVMLEGLLHNNGTMIREILVMTPEGWTTVSVDFMHPWLQCAPMVYDENFQSLVLYGGETGQGGQLYDHTIALHPSNVV